MPGIRETSPEKVEDILRRFPDRNSASIPLLYLAWDVYGYVSPEAMEEVADIMNTTPAHIQGIASFYTMFPLSPRGKYHIEICNNASCWLVGSQNVVDTIEEKLGIKNGETTPDGKFSLQTVECLAGCSWAPCLQVNGTDHFKVSSESVHEILDACE